MLCNLSNATICPERLALLALSAMHTHTRKDQNQSIEHQLDPVVHITSRTGKVPLGSLPLSRVRRTRNLPSQSQRTRSAHSENRAGARQSDLRSAVAALQNVPILARCILDLSSISFFWMPRSASLPLERRRALAFPFPVKRERRHLLVVMLYVPVCVNTRN